MSSKLTLDRFHAYAAELLSGLSLGLKRFTGSERVALIVKLRPNTKARILDPRGLLSDHKKVLGGLYEARKLWPDDGPKIQSWNRGSWKALTIRTLPGLLGYGSQSKSLYSQIWIAEKPDYDISDITIKRFLGRAATLLRTLAFIRDDLLENIFKHELEFFSFHAVREAIKDQFEAAGHSTSLPIQDILWAIAKLSLAREEGRRIKGSILFADASAKDCQHLITLSDENPPKLNEVKRIGKLLTATANLSRAFLISDGHKITGIGAGSGTAPALSAQVGAQSEVLLNGNRIAICRNGEYSIKKPAYREYDLQKRLERSLPEANKKQLIKVILRIAGTVNQEGHGCGIVILPQPNTHKISAELINPVNILPRQKPNLTTIIAGLAQMDGAIIINTKGDCLAAGCILDGKACPTKEDRSRGARYNSALRYSIQHKDAVIVTLSEDGPASVFKAGREISAEPRYDAVKSADVEAYQLSKWLKMNLNPDQALSSI